MSEENQTQDGEKVWITCGHLSTEANDDCQTCQKFKTDPGFREAVARNQSAIRAMIVGGEQASKLCRYISDAPIDRLDCNCSSKWIHACDVYGECCRNDPENKFEIQSCSDCVHYVSRESTEDDKKIRRVILIDKHAPGDVVAMTAAVQSLHKAHPGKFVVDVETCAPDVWIGNRDVRKLSGEAREQAERHEIKYDAVNRSNEIPIHFMEAYCWGLSEALGVRVPLSTNIPKIHIKAEERGWMSQIDEMFGAVGVPYVVFNAGHKSDFTAKFWGTSNWKTLAEMIGKDIIVVQIGEASDGHYHDPLPGVVNLIGKTTQRQLIRLIANARVCVGPPTFIQHIAAAVGVPYVLIAGGREPVIWQHYPKQITLSSVGTLPCCEHGSCWKTRTIKLSDDSEHNKSVCEMPVIVPVGSKGVYDVVPKCLNDIGPDIVSGYIKKILRLKK